MSIRDSKSRTHFKPTCRYEHGPLRLVTTDGDTEKNVWKIESGDEKQMFSGHLYVCSECGYIEFFDNDIDRTRRELDAEDE